MVEASPTPLPPPFLEAKGLSAPLSTLLLGVPEFAAERAGLLPQHNIVPPTIENHSSSMFHWLVATGTIGCRQSRCFKTPPIDVTTNGGDRAIGGNVRIENTVLLL